VVDDVVDGGVVGAVIKAYQYTLPFFPTILTTSNPCAPSKSIIRADTIQNQCRIIVIHCIDRAF